jgi:hypothetical protein
MIKVTKVFILLLLSFWTTTSGQQLSHQVLVPAAGTAIAGSLNYSQSIGETAVETVDGSGFVLTQGFQQPAMIFSDVIPHVGTGVDVYPNPATHFVSIKLFGDSSRKFRIEMISITGRIVNSMELEFITKYYHIQQLDVSRLTNGFYFVRVTSEDSKINRIFKIEKM